MLSSILSKFWTELSNVADQGSLIILIQDSFKMLSRFFSEISTMIFSLPFKLICHWKLTKNGHFVSFLQSFSLPFDHLHQIRINCPIIQHRITHYIRPLISGARPRRLCSQSRTESGVHSASRKAVAQGHCQPSASRKLLPVSESYGNNAVGWTTGLWSSRKVAGR